MEVANWITAISTLVMAIATIVMAVAAWQAKNGFIKQRGYEDYLKITELLDNCQRKILFLPAELADNSYRKTYTKQMTDSINKINRMIKSVQNYLSKNKMLELSLLYKEILKFHTQLIQESCNYEGLKYAHNYYLENMSKIKGEDCIEQLLLNAKKNMEKIS